jgi:hypothetical protein
VKCCIEGLSVCSTEIIYTRIDWRPVPTHVIWVNAIVSAHETAAKRWTETVLNRRYGMLSTVSSKTAKPRAKRGRAWQWCPIYCCTESWVSAPKHGIDNRTGNNRNFGSFMKEKNLVAGNSNVRFSYWKNRKKNSFLFAFCVMIYRNLTKMWQCSMRATDILFMNKQKLWLIHWLSVVKISHFLYEKLFLYTSRLYRHDSRPRETLMNIRIEDG